MGAGKHEEDGSFSGAEIKKPVNGHKMAKTGLCKAEIWARSLGREWDAAWHLLTANPHSQELRRQRKMSKEGLGVTGKL